MLLTASQQITMHALHNSRKFLLWRWSQADQFTTGVPATIWQVWPIKEIDVKVDCPWHLPICESLGVTSWAVNPSSCAICFCPKAADLANGSHPPWKSSPFLRSTDFSLILKVLTLCWDVFWVCLFEEFIQWSRLDEKKREDHWARNVKGALSQRGKARHMQGWTHALASGGQSFPAKDSLQKCGLLAVGDPIRRLALSQMLPMWQLGMNFRKLTNTDYMPFHVYGDLKYMYTGMGCM